MANDQPTTGRWPQRLSFFTRASDGSLNLAARHPWWSMTWTWVLSWERLRPGERRWLIQLTPGRQPHQVTRFAVALGWWRLRLMTQPAEAFHGR